MGVSKYATALISLKELNITPLEIYIYNTLSCVLENENLEPKDLERFTAHIYKEFLTSPGIGIDEIMEDALYEPTKFIKNCNSYIFYDRRVESLESLNKELPPFIVSEEIAFTSTDKENNDEKEEGKNKD